MRRWLALLLLMLPACGVEDLRPEDSMQLQIVHQLEQAIEEDDEEPTVLQRLFVSMVIQTQLGAANADDQQSAAEQSEGDSQALIEDSRDTAASTNPAVESSLENAADEDDQEWVVVLQVDSSSQEDGEESFSTNPAVEDGRDEEDSTNPAIESGTDDAADDDEEEDDDDDDDDDENCLFCSTNPAVEDGDDPPLDPDSL